MAEGMNQMNQDELMLLDGFEQMAKALGAEIPIGLAEDLAAIRNGMPMSDNMRKTLAEGSVKLHQQLKDQGVTPDMIKGTNPDVMKDPSMGAVSEGEMKLAQGNRAGTMGAVSDSEMQMAQDSLARLGLAPMTDEERMSYQVDGGMEQMTPSQMAGMQESGAITPDAGRVMSMEEAIAAGIVTPTRPQARPMMTSPRPQMRR